MGRTQRALTSLVGAIPAGFLLYLLIMVFLSNSEKLPTMLMVVVGMTLAAAFVVTLMPFGLLIFGGKKAAKDDVDEAPVATKKQAKDSDEDLAVADEEEAEIEEAVEESSSDFDIADSDVDVMSDSDDAIASGSSIDEMDAFDEDEDEPPAPKKRKK